MENHPEIASKSLRNVKVTPAKSWSYRLKSLFMQQRARYCIAQRCSGRSERLLGALAGDTHALPFAGGECHASLHWVASPARGAGGSPSPCSRPPLVAPPQRRARSQRGHASRPLPARPPPPSRPTPALAALALWSCKHIITSALASSQQQSTPRLASLPAASCLPLLSGDGD